MLITPLLLCAFATTDVSFDEAIAWGEKLPAVKAVEESLNARQKGDEAIGGTLQPTQVTLMPGGAQSRDGERGLEWQANVLQGFNLKGLGGARRKTAQAEREALLQQKKLEALKGRWEAARWWLQLFTLEQLESLLESEVKLAQSYAESVERALKAGVGTSADVAEARSALAELQQERLTVEGLRFEAAAHLGQAMGRPLAVADTHPPLHTKGDVPAVTLPALEDLSARTSSFEQLPEVKLQRLLEWATQARKAEVSAQFAPLLQLGTQWERTLDSTTIGYGVATLTFDAFGNGARDVSQARAQAEAARWESLSVAQKAQTEWVLAVHEVEHTTQQLSALEKDVLPWTTALKERREMLLRAGEGTVFELLSAKRKETQALLQRERIRGEKLWAQVHLMLLLSELP